MPTQPPTSDRRGRGAGRGGSRAERRAARKASGRRNIFWRWRRFFFLCALLFVLGIAGAGWAMTRVTLPASEPPLAQTSFVCASDVTTGCNADNSIAQLSGTENRVSVTYDELPQVLINAVVAAEDREFFTHSGVDPAGIVRAFWSNFRSSGTTTQGGSTITQQYVKNVYLTQERTFTRKITEAALAVQVERELSKQEILTRYLNVVYLGRGAYGVQAASRAYFGKDVKDVTLPEAAYLAGLLRSPELTDAHLPDTDPRAQAQRDLATSRRNSVLDAMLTEQYISQQQVDQAKATGWGDILARTKSGNYGRVAHPELGTEYFLDYVKHWLTTSAGFDPSQLYGGGLRIYTTLDFDLQEAAVDAVTSTLDRESDPDASLVSVDSQGMVRAMVGGLDHAASQVNLAVGKDGGGGSGRGAGSSFKPIVLAEALKQGMSLNQTYDSPGKMTFPKANNGEDWPVGNYSDAVGQGELTLAEAMVRSSNTAYAQLIMDVGANNSAALARNMGVASPVRSVPAQVLGTDDVSPLDMATAFSTFANQGEHIGPFVVSHVTDAQGTVLWEAPSERTRVLSEDVADQVNWALSQVIESPNGTGGKAKIPQPAAGKTGTTDKYRDAWFVGYTCSLTSAVWMGYSEPDENSKTKYMTNVHGQKVTGGSFPAEIWAKYMKVATKDLPSCPFERPKSVKEPNTTAPGTSMPSSSTTVSPSSTTTPPTSVPRSTTTTEPAPTTTEPPTSSTTIPPSSSTTIPPP